MSEAPTDRARLVEAALVPQVTTATLYDYVRERREAGASWRAVAQEIWSKTGIDVSDVTVASWYPDLRQGPRSDRSGASEAQNPRPIR